MKNIEYQIKTINDYAFIEAKLLGSVRNESWNLFIEEIIENCHHAKSLYLLIDENNQVSEIDFYTIQDLIDKSLVTHFDEVILSFATKDPIKVTLERLFHDMAEIAEVPLRVTFHRTMKDAASLIKNFCLKCEATMFPNQKS